MPTPVVFDQFSRTMAGGFLERDYVSLPTAGQRFFGRTETASFTVFSPNSAVLDIEIVRANQKLAALVPRGQIGKFIGTTHLDGQLGQGTMFSRKYPLIEEEIPLDSNQLLMRVIGLEGPYENLTQTDRMRLLGRLGYIELMRRIIRLQEYLAWQSLTLGKQSCQAVGTPGANDYDWRRNSSNTASLTHGWGNASGVPLTDIDTACDQIAFAGKVEPKYLFLGGNAMKYFLTNTQVITYWANHFYWDFVRFSLDFTPTGFLAELVAGGAKPVGRLKTPKGYTLDVLTYPKMYEASGGTAAKYLNDDYAFLAGDARADRYFGPPERLPLSAQKQAEMMERFGFNPATPVLPQNIEGGAGSVISPQMYYCDSYDSEDNKRTTLRLQGAPVYPTTQTDGFYTMTNAGSTS